jgi:hypothetical protein
MSSIARMRLYTFLGSACLGVVSTSCNQLPPERGEHVQTVASEKLESKNPIEVVVAPVANATGDDTVPIVPAARSLPGRSSVRRRYSPLALEYVDKKVVDATYTPGSLQESAVLQVEIQGWVTRRSSRRARRSRSRRARASSDAEDPSRAELWSGFIDHRFDFEADHDKYPAREAFQHYVCGRIADELLAALPAREAGPAR